MGVTLVYLAFSDGPKIQVWDIRTRRILPALTQEGGEISTIAFCPTESCLAAGAEDKKVRIWRVPDGELTMTIPQDDEFSFGHGDVKFTGDGRYLVVTQGVEDGPYGEFARLILWRPEDVVRDACRRLIRHGLTRAEWPQFFLKDEPYRETCPAEKPLMHVPQR